MLSDWCPEGWCLVKLSDLGEVNRGRSRYRPRYAKHLYGGAYPFIQTGDIKASGGRIRRYEQTYSEAGLAQSRLWPLGTLCITIAANIAETGVLQFPACFPDSVIGFIPDTSKANVYFVEYMFRYLRRRIQHEATGSVQDNINLATLERLRFPLPPRSIQEAIAYHLGNFDDNIELNRRMNETLEAMARTLFKSWFVDRSGKDTFGWKQLCWGDVVSLEYGKSLRGYENEQGGYPVFGTNGLIGRHSEPLCPHPGIIIGRKGAYRGVHYSSRPFFVIDTAFYIELKGPVDLRWAYYQLLREDINSMDSGSAIPSTSREDFYKLPLRLPPLDEQRRFVEALEPCWSREEANNDESKTLAAIRDALLPKLLSGEIRVKEAEKLVEVQT